MKITSKEENGNLIVEIEGSIDEDAVFDSVDLSVAGKIMIDLGKVNSINSCGIREWVKWLREKKEGNEISLRKCPKVIVDQINMVSGFLPDGANVESFYVPFYNEETDNEKFVLFTKGKEYSDSEVNVPEVKDDDGTDMELDVIEAKYFKFLKG
jgi:anti-anti-sigma regulatory factor